MSQLVQALVQQSKHLDAHIALVEGETRWTYPQLVDQIDRAATGFQSIGVQPGQRVALMLLNQKEFLVCFFALRKIGAVVVPINIQMLPQDIGFVIQNSGVRHIVVESALYAHLAHVPLNLIVVGEPQEGRMTYESLLTHGDTLLEEVTEEEGSLAFLIYTSGTTGYPKGVMLTEKNILANMEGFKQVLDFEPTDRMVLALPLFHAYGLIVALACLLNGGAMTLVPKFLPKKIVEAMAQEQVTILPLVPTLFTVILELVARQEGLKFPHLRFCVSGGASLPVALLDKIHAVLHAPVIEGYGLTETAPVLAVNDPKIGPIPGSVGKPLPNVQIKIVRDDGSECVTGEIGEVLAKGDNIMQGYFNLPEDTQAVFTPDGWFRTGDLGHLDAEGRLYISGGRIKDLIIKAGENISPLPIEQVLYRHEAVREAAVVGTPHDKLGEEIVACVALNPGQEQITTQDLIRFCREHLNATFIPGSVEFFDELPKNPTGKIVKKLLKELLSQRASLPG